MPHVRTRITQPVGEAGGNLAVSLCVFDFIFFTFDIEGTQSEISLANFYTTCETFKRLKFYHHNSQDYLKMTCSLKHYILHL